MYAQEIVEKRLTLVRRKGLKVTRRSRDESISQAKALERLRRDPRGQTLPPGRMSRDPTPAEREFIVSEQVLAKIDFTYFAERYGAIRRDPSVGRETGIGPPLFLPSQRRIVELLGRRETECHAEVRASGRTRGIQAYLHKSRQMCATATARLMTWHRMIFYPGTRSLSATLDATRVSQVFTEYDTTIVENLPWWLDPGVRLRPVNELFVLENESSCAYQAENQQQGRGGLGVGGQFDVSHFTEVALWQNPDYIGFSFRPSMPQALTTLHIQESTSRFKGYWWMVSENSRHKRRGYEATTYVFIPWYFNPTKWTDAVPGDWTPDERTLEHAELVERTSPEWHDGRTVRLNRGQMYWWETTRAQAVREGALADFFMNYPATPEQSWQHPAQGALPVEVLEKMEAGVWIPRAFDVEVARG